jgi:hypothetical protein
MSVKNLQFEFKTAGQEVIYQALYHAARNNKKVFLLDREGSGFKYTLQKAFRDPAFRSVKVITVSVIPTLNASKVVLTMFKKCSTVRFSNLKHKYLDPHEMLLKIGSRLRQDLLGKRILLVFDHMHSLKSMDRMASIVNLLLAIPFSCGVILRTQTSHIKRIEEEDKGLYATIRTGFDFKAVPQLTRDDVHTMCHAHGVMDKNLINELASSKNQNLKIVQYFIDEAKKLEPYTQMSLF